MFLDETAAATIMARRYGWASRGGRCRLAATFGHYKTTTITAALRTSGLYAIAPLDGPRNGTRFCRYVTETLVPVLQPDDIVVMDNLRAHKVAGVQDAIKAAGARPPARSRISGRRSARHSRASLRRSVAIT
ncbi:hypothetical protein MSPGM_36790 [Methylorubrum sp. GM97]|nr:hypothetical protein MSPGM_36790 [Methylorubrum sp. GM97]